VHSVKTKNNVKATPWKLSASVALLVGNETDHYRCCTVNNLAYHSLPSHTGSLFIQHRLWNEKYPQTR